MVNQKTENDRDDLRIKRTKVSLFQAFGKLIETKNFEDISVNELCDEALIRRATFYNHYTDKYEFFADLVRKLFRKFTDTSGDIEASTDSVGRYIVMVKRVLDFVEGNPRIVRSLMRSRLTDLLYSIITSELENTIKQNLRMDFPADRMDDTQLEIMTQVFTGSITNICKWWIFNTDSISKDDLLERIGTLLSRVLQAG